ncbi:receptor-like protein 6 [Dioscorea cayenensis subsp. rotundata]|uniref:Receptor-like protein 6 n=1 Tax=Dioscorea cayennensis subsp. rotundata TaxID=55577 RepID=A0AB40BR48_DIOCR|nr:receptor-like protein 6 [Dioscorea cayenensis subsp. rotundata]
MPLVLPPPSPSSSPPPVGSSSSMISSDDRSVSIFLLFIPCSFLFLFILVPFSLSSSTSANSQQCLDLLDLKKSFIMLNASTDIDYYFPATTSLPHWLPGTDCCGWEGVSCDEASDLVVSLDLSERYMGGNIMPSLFNLTSLQTLNLAYNSFNQLSAVLLLDLEKLANLTHLNLSYSGLLVGQVPISISRLTKLISLDLSTYDIYPLKLEKPDLGTLIGDLSHLKELYLDEVDISSSTTEWSQAISHSVPGLEALSLIDCSLSGPIDSSFSKLQNLSILHLDSNSLSQVPEFFAKFPSLSVLSLKPIPRSIWNLSELVNLNLADNHLFGDLPPMPASSKISILDLSYNNVTGLISSTLSSARQLVSLDLAGNSLTGSIPMSLFTLPQLEKLYLADNKLSGQLQEFKNASSTLQYVDLSGNNLRGKLPKSLANLSALVLLDLGSNNFDGSVVELELFGYLQNLRVLDLSGINFLTSNRIADSSHLFPSLTQLELESCNLTAIPSFLKHKKNIFLLNLSYNRINGTIPTWIWSIGSFFKFMYLAFNSFTDIEKTFLKHSNNF